MSIGAPLFISLLLLSCQKTQPDLSDQSINNLVAFTKLYGAGIQPTIPVHKTIKGIIEGRDEQLQKALEVVSR